ncbi:hemerythrin domain-containing protein [Agromyces neolithicus]|uniref:Hemerythrin-like domain-containing protein n=1 Tax=Agromyces neolithicus TaxID=269420 RepID=A0ABP4YM51_9MICO
MARRLASTGAVGCDTGDMIVVHRFFRKVFGDARRLVDDVAEGDRERAGAVGRFTREIAGSLHAHHQGEDLMLWDRLSDRAPKCAAHVERMRAQHAAIAERLVELERVTPAWEASASDDDRARLRVALDDVLAALAVHLGDEEASILPVAGPVFTQKEWDQLGAHARAQVPVSRLLVQLGMILDSFPDDERDAWFTTTFPAPLRLLYGVLGRPRYEAEMRKLHGTG